MKFPWGEYEELPVKKRNTLQVFVTNRCNLRCEGCFARKLLVDNTNISMGEYVAAIDDGVSKGVKQVNLLGGEPLLHPDLLSMIALNREKELSTTVYTNGYFLNRFTAQQFEGAKLRVSVYCKTDGIKSSEGLPQTDIPFDANFMVSSKTKLEELVSCAEEFERERDGKVFFISSIRELDNPQKEFFTDTDLTMPVLDYKKLVHQFLERYNGNMAIHVSKRGVFESTLDLPVTKCAFANYIIGGRIVQCPYDLVNEKFQQGYEFGKRNCQQNSTCLMSKVVYRRKKS
ncbi:7-carboxy-7-deazaguanine synthase [uncultured archaeon]|nr:7-carboxy-7-deazaguanine synthase [uncultured archaeon]